VNPGQDQSEFLFLEVEAAAVCLELDFLCEWLTVILSLKGSLCYSIM